MESDEKLPRAFIARVPSPAGTKTSAVLVPRSMGFLAVKLVVDGYPVEDIPVGFFEREAGGKKGDAICEPVVSDGDGVARLPRVVPTGTYLCQVAGQEREAVVATVDRLHDAWSLPLPIGAETVE